ncbi:MAG: hypothetical protein AB1716_12475 [Planctomycetota bacterium]
MHQTGRRRRALAGLLLAAGASVGLMAFPLLSRMSFLGERAALPLVFGLTIAMGCGAILAVFSLGEDRGSQP